MVVRVAMLVVAGALLGANAETLSCTLPKSISLNSSQALEATCSSACQLVAEEAPEPVPLDENVGLAFGLVVAAGMSTSIGAALVFVDCCVTQRNNKVLAASLGFSAGVMMYVSFVEIFVKSVDDFEGCGCLWEHEDPRAPAQIMATVCFFGGILFFQLLDLLVHRIKPHMIIRRKRKDSKKTGSSGDGSGDSLNADRANAGVEMGRVPAPASQSLHDGADLALEDGGAPIAPTTSLAEGRASGQDDGKETVQFSVCMCDDAHCESPADAHSGEQPEVLDLDEVSEEEKRKALNRMGTMTALAIGLHNFPEGLATFAGALADPSVGVALAVAIAIHNVPEGLCVSIPIYYATGSRWRGFWLATASGVAELVGAALGYAFLMAIFGPTAYAVLFGLVAGMMVAIVVSELLPTALRYDPHGHVANGSFFLGAFVMALSLVLFQL